MTQPILVIKFGGSVLADGLATFASAVAARVKAGRRVVIVHGGGKEIDAWLSRLQIPSVFVDGLRVTDQATLDVAEMTLSGRVNKVLVRALLNRGLPAIGLSGVDGGILRTEPASLPTDEKHIDLGRVGRVTQVDAAPIQALLAAGYVPVISPLGWADDGGAHNVNADAAAGAIAGGLAGELRLLTDVAGVLSDKLGDLLEHVTPAEAAELRANGVLRGGMIPKVEACLAALAQGAATCRIQALSAFVEGHDAGTQITKEVTT